MTRFTKVLAVAAASLGVAAGAASGGTIAPGPLTGAVHGTIVAQKVGGITDTVTYDRGLITANTGTSITITRRDGQVLTFSVGGDTVVLEQGKAVTLASLKLGETPMFFSRGGHAFLIRCVSGGTDDASGADDPTIDRVGVLVGVFHADLTMQMRDGSTAQSAYDRGRITANGAGSITLKRADKLSVTLSTGSDTVVVEKGVLSTVDALKVGEGAMFFSRAGRAYLIRCVSGG